MPSLTVVGRDGVEHVVEGRPGASVMQAVSEAGFTDMFAICNGCCICATCHVYVDAVDAARLPPVADEERELLAALDNRRPASRLSCQITLAPETDGIRVTIAPDL
jgi:ferredoxin, 2Fe-2S